MVHCWKTMYNLLELYSTMPTTKTVQRHSLTPITSSSMLDAGILLRAGQASILCHYFHTQSPRVILFSASSGTPSQKTEAEAFVGK
jgi:hypothetical protein